MLHQQQPQTTSSLLVGRWDVWIVYDISYCCREPPLEDILANMHCHMLMSVICFTQDKISWWFCVGVVEVSFCYIVLPLLIICQDSVWEISGIWVFPSKNFIWPGFLIKLSYINISFLLDFSLCILFIEHNIAFLYIVSLRG